MGRSTSVSKPVNYIQFSEFNMDEDLGWLYGTWELLEWKVDEHGEMKDYTNSWNYKLLEVNGKSKSSPLIEETKNAKTSKISKHEYTIEKYFTLNNHVKGHFNKVNSDKTMLLLRRESALDEDVLFIMCSRKSKHIQFRTQLLHAT